MFTGMLKKGDTINWSYKSDFFVDNMGADGSYTTQAQSDTNETLTIDKVKTVPFYEYEKDLEQAHYSVKNEYAKKAMNKIFLQIDADVLYAAQQGAANTIDNEIITGQTSAGTPITVGSTNIQTIFVSALGQLQLNNVVYDPNMKFTNEVKLEKAEGMPVAIISVPVYQALLTYLGGKTTVLGDKVSVSGHAGAFESFNIFVSNALPSSVVFSMATAGQTALDTFTINGMTFTFNTVLGATPGSILVGAADTAAHTQTLLTSIFANLFTNATSGSYAATATNWVPFTSTVAHQQALQNLTLSSWASNKATLTQSGTGVMQVTAVSFTASTSTIGGTQTSATTAATVTQHCIFGVSKSVALCLQHTPTLYINPVSGKIGKDYVTWCFYGLKVFLYQTYQLIDVKINATSFVQPSLVSY